MSGKILIISFIFLISFYNNNYCQYNPSNATSYADEWCDDGPNAKGYNAWNNPQGHEATYYNDFSGKFNGTDCANFVSQCLIKGGIGQEIINFIQEKSYQNYAGRLFDASNPDKGQDLGDAVGIALGGIFGTIANAQKLDEFLRDYYHAQYICGKISDIIDQGDVFIRYSPHPHAMFISTGTSINSTYDAHTEDRLQESVNTKFPNYDNGLHFFHMVRTVPDVEHVEVKQGTDIIYDGRWYGTNSPRNLNISTQNDVTCSTKDLVITIDFNESVQNVQVTAKNIPIMGKLNPQLSTQWIGKLPQSQFSEGRINGDISLIIKAKNFASSSNLLDANPQTVPIWRDASRDFSNYEDYSKDPNNYTSGGDDSWHHFKINTFLPFTVTVSPIQNSVKKGDSASHKITIKNLDPFNAATFDVQLSPLGVGWKLLPKTEFLNVPVADGWPYRVP